MDDQFDEGYIDDIYEMLGDIHAAHNLSVNDDMNIHTGEPSSTRLERTTFEQLLKNACCLLNARCATFSKLSFIVKLFHIKTVDSWNVKSFDMLIKLLKIVFPKTLLPNSFQEA